MILHCPACGLQHIDAPEEGLDAFAGDIDAPIPPPAWANPPHRSHLCHGCGHIWRPADVPTEGVAAIQTRGKDDSPPALSRPSVEGWRPIEEAPKGECLLVWWDKGHHFATLYNDGRWYSEGEEIHPTHYRPLPSPPTGGGE